MEEMKKIRTCAIISLVLSIVIVVVILASLLLVGAVVGGAAGAMGVSGAAVGGIMVVATVMSLVLNGGIQFLFSLLILIKSRDPQKAGLCFGFGIVVLVVSAFWLLTGLGSINLMTFILAGEVVASALIVANANKVKKTLAGRREEKTEHFSEENPEEQQPDIRE